MFKIKNIKRIEDVIKKIFKELIELEKNRMDSIIFVSVSELYFLHFA